MKSDRVNYTKSNVELAAALEPFVRYIRAIEVVAAKRKIQPDWNNSDVYPFEECIDKLIFAGFRDEAHELNSLVAKKLKAVNWVLETQREAMTIAPGTAEPKVIKTKKRRRAKAGKPKHWHAKAKSYLQQMNGEIPDAEVARLCGVSASVLSRDEAYQALRKAYVVKVPVKQNSKNF